MSDSSNSAPVDHVKASGHQNLSESSGVALEPNDMPETGQFLDIFTHIVDHAEAAGHKDLLKTLSRTCRRLSLYSFHRACHTFDLRTPSRRSTFNSLVKSGIAVPSKVLGIRIDLSEQDASAALRLFLKSQSLVTMELYGNGDQSPQPHLVHLVAQIASSSERPIGFIFVNMRIVPWTFIKIAQCLIFEASDIEPCESYPALDCVLPLRTITFATSTGGMSLEALFGRRVYVPYLTHLLMNFKPSETTDMNMNVHYDLTEILLTSKALEEITIVYRPNYKMSTSDIADELRALAKKLVHVTHPARREITLDFHFESSGEHALQFLPFLKILRDFKLISIAIPGNPSLVRRLLRLGYQLFVASGNNTSFRVDRIVKDERTNSSIIFGCTVRDVVTRECLSRVRSHYNVCGPRSRRELGKGGAEWRDNMVPVEEL
ncbi:hypothetical protein CVT26_002288 [Gymnopilus dilepis]|uniref:F-box domain-containing protein n=1 Tax=Gymnopilus dilepis TaxID=231916 RepID=A0A409YN21_9AGAR|nr:hypothetical protein CVT26_002288 [Gymnopilus dilepis]